MPNSNEPALDKTALLEQIRESIKVDCGLDADVAAIVADLVIETPDDDAVSKTVTSLKALAAKRAGEVCP